MPITTPISRKKRPTTKPKRKTPRPQLTAVELQRLVERSKPEEWNANDDVDVFTPARKAKHA